MTERLIQRLNDGNLHQLRGQKIYAQLPVEPSGKKCCLLLLSSIPLSLGKRQRMFFLVQHCTVFIKRELQAEHSLFHIADLPFVSLRTFQWNREKMRIL